MKDGGVGDEKLLFQAEATAYRLSMPVGTTITRLLLLDEAQNTHARGIVLYRLASGSLLSQSQRRSIIIAKP